MSNIVKNYFKIFEVKGSLNIVLNTEVRTGRKLKIYDKEIADLSLTSECMSINSQNSFLISCKME